MGRKEGQPRGNAHASEWFATRDPLDRVDTAGNPLSEPERIDIGTGGFDGPESEAPEQGTLDVQARVVATEARPVCALRPSSEDELVQLHSADAVAPGSQRVTKRYGSLAKPFSYEEFALDPLFIGGSPHVEDVQQGGLGSCYLLADLLSVASQDPAHIEGMISVQGGVAVVMFHRYDEQAKTWVPVPVAINTTLARDAKNAGTLQGSGFRVAKEPVSAAWYAEVNAKGDEGELVIIRQTIHEAAMWVPLIEKAYARYSEMYGQYGGHPKFATEEKGGGSGYDNTEGGWGSATMRVLYGEGVADGQLKIKGGTSSTLIGNNLDRMLALLGMTKAGGGKTMMSASAGSDDLPNRLFLLLRRVIESPHDMRPELRATCDTTLATADIARQVGAEALPALIRQARALVDAVPQETSGDLGKARDLAMVLMNAGVTNEGGPRSIYADHAYAVLGATLRDGAGAELSIGATDLPKRLGEIDGTRSDVTVRNPHRGNEPDKNGDGPDDGVDEGSFQLPLERFLTLFTKLDVASRR
ncbi:MAG: hypothetical protein Q8P18_08285 [Pseudomonadota bacterium]|nr:hypothetical protein [Pseudomonadota bacterium]